MKHILFVCCIAGILIIAACAAWWSFHKGEDHAKVQVGIGDEAAAKAHGPYRLAPDDNPVQVSVSLVISPVSSAHALAQGLVNVSMFDSGGVEVWQDSRRPQSGAYRGEEDAQREGGGGIIELNTFEAIEIKRIERYTFRCRIEPGSADFPVDALSATLTIRKNAHQFPAYWAALGFGMIIIAAIALQVRSEERGDEAPPQPPRPGPSGVPPPPT